MTLEDMTMDEFFASSAISARADGYEVLWTPDMPDGIEDARKERSDWPGGGGFVSIYNERLRDDGGSPMFLSFPVDNIMRASRRFSDRGKRDGFLLAVKAKRRLTNALLICTSTGRAVFQLGVFGKKFLFLEDVPEAPASAD